MSGGYGTTLDTVKALLRDAHDKGIGCQLHELHHYAQAVDGLDALASELIRLRVALDAVTALRREGRYNTAEECRTIARTVLR